MNDFRIQKSLKIIFYANFISSVVLLSFFVPVVLISILIPQPSDSANSSSAPMLGIVVAFVLMLIFFYLGQLIAVFFAVRRRNKVALVILIIIKYAIIQISLFLLGPNSGSFSSPLVYLLIIYEVIEAIFSIIVLLINYKYFFRPKNVTA